MRYLDQFGRVGKYEGRIRIKRVYSCVTKMLCTVIMTEGPTLVINRFISYQCRVKLLVQGAELKCRNYRQKKSDRSALAQQPCMSFVVSFTRGRLGTSEDPVFRRRRVLEH